LRDRHSLFENLNIRAVQWTPELRTRTARAQKQARASLLFFEFWGPIKQES